MSKKSFVVLVFLSIVVTYVVTFIDVVFNGSVVAGDSGIPLRFDSSVMFGGGSTNYLNLFIDIVFWFFVVWVIWVVLKRLMKK